VLYCFFFEEKYPDNRNTEGDKEQKQGGNTKISDAIHGLKQIFVHGVKVLSGLEGI